MSNNHVRDVLNYIFLLHPGYGYVHTYVPKDTYIHTYIHVHACEPEEFSTLGTFVPERAVAVSSPSRVDYVSLCICLLVSHRCVSLLVRVWALDVWGELVPSDI